MKNDILYMKGVCQIMAVSLTKGGNVSLSKEAPNLSAILIGLGWDVSPFCQRYSHDLADSFHM